MPLEPCTPEEDADFAEISRWCYKTRQQVRTLRWADQEFIVRDKARKQPKPSWLRQKERAAIDRLMQDFPATTQSGHR